MQYFNHKYKRTGTLWEGRFKSCLVDSDIYLLVCYRYIELNPVRAKMIKQPGEYQWSSYRINTGLKKSGLITPHEIYLQLGNSDKARTDAYKALFLEKLTYLQLDNIRAATSRGLVVGSDAFKDKIEQMIGQSVRPNPVGRPREVRENSAIYFYL